MAISVVGMSVAFAGSAAATVDDFDGLAADDVTAGTSGVTQDVTLQDLENDGTTATITISNDAGLDDSVITGASVKSANGHDVTGVNVQSNGDIVVDLGNSGGGTTANLVLTVTHDLTSTQDATVTYTATTDSGITQTATFDVSVAQPEYTDDDATIPETNPDTIEITFDEPVQEAASPGTHEDAFTLSSAGGVSVSDFNSIKGTNTVVLDLSANVGAGVTDPTIAYDGDGGSATNPIVHADDSSVVAQDVSAKNVVSNAVPVITDAKVDDGDRDLLKITTSENVDAAGLADDAFSLGDSQANVDSVDSSSDGSTSIDLKLNSAINPGDDLTGLSYDRNAGDVVASGDTNDELYAQGVTVTNNVVPNITAAEVTSANPDRILVSYNGSVQSGDTGVVNDFTATGSISIDTGGSADFSAGTDSQLALPLSGSVAAGDGDVGNLDYDNAGGADGVESTASVDALVPDNNNDIANNVEPIIQSATVLDGSPGEVQVTFRENVVANVSGTPSANLDSAVTEAFEFKNNDVDLRIKNVESFGGPSSTITLNFGAADGTSQEVKATDDLTGALTYEPDAPTDEAETFPLIADGGTSAAVPQQQNLDVTNNLDVDLSVAKIVTDGQEIRVTFTEDVTKVGTVSDIENAFDVGQSAVTIDDSNTFSGIENGDTVVFNNSLGSGFVATPGSYHSGTDFGVDTESNGLQYDASAGNSPLEDATGTAVPDFGTVTRKDITNNIQPRIESAEVLDSDRDEIQLTYTEDITGSDANAYESFSLDGNQAPSITGQNDASTNTIDLALDSDVANGDDLGTLTYTDSASSDEIKSGNSGNTIALDGESVAVTNSVGTAPVLQNVTIDDAAVNNNYGTNGEMLLAFDEPVVESSDDTSGLTFDSGLEGVSVSTVDVKNPGDSPNNVIIVTYTSDSGSASSNIQDTDDLSGATLTVDNAANVGITGDAPDNNQITENTVSDVSNEIAGDLAEVDSSDITVDILGAQEDDQSDTGDDNAFTVTISGLTDGNGNKVIDETIDIRIGDYSEPTSIENINTENNYRFSEEIKITGVNIVKGNVNSGDIGKTLEVNVTDTNDNEITPDNADTVEFVDEAYKADQSGTFITSQPMAGELVTDSDIASVQAYNASGDSFPSYSELSTAQKVHYGLYIEADQTDAVYGYTYDREASGIGVSEYEMPEGWNVISSNYQIENNANIQADRDLDFADQPFPSSDAVRITALDDSQQGLTLGTPISSGDNIDQYEAYFVNMGESNDRAIVTSPYTGSGPA